MLRSELLDVLNSGTAWALLGSGPSIDSGLPTWEELIKEIINALDPPRREAVENDSTFAHHWNQGALSHCLTRIEYFVGRGKLEFLVRSILSKPVTPSDIVRLIADLPFEGYITINYDSLLETALRVHGGGWLSVGNSPSEIRKVSGGASEIVWHIHGAVEQGNDKSKLVLTDNDYGDLYLENSPAVDQLRALMAQRRVVVIGFGFRDPEVMRILRRVGRFTNPARPIYAFIGGLIGAEHLVSRQELLRQCNVDVIPYNQKWNQRQLTELLGVYSSLVLRRSLKFNNPARPCPSYDPETTGLLLYNEFCLRPGSGFSEDIFAMLVRARILSLLRYGVPSREEVLRDVATRARLIRLDRSESETNAFVDSVLAKLHHNGLVTNEEPPRLTQEGERIVAEQVATSERLAEQFSASLISRCRALISGKEDAARRVATAAETFLKDCIRLKALGVAMAKFASRAEEQSFHMVALLQGLPEFMAQLSSQEEALALSTLVQGVLSDPSDHESRYIGLALQAQFGVHLLGYDQPTLDARARDLAATFFLLDSSVVIQAIARSSVGHDFARLLSTSLLSANSTVATTTRLADEVSEHARYAASTADGKTGQTTFRTLESATGRTSGWVNAFIGGFSEEVHQGRQSDLRGYLNSVLDSNRRDGLYTREEIEGVLYRNGIGSIPFDKFEGFDQTMYAERDEVQEKIASLRDQRGTYRHERQVKAEAEALMIIRNVRSRAFKFSGTPAANAFFVSHTRIIDDLGDDGTHVTIRPESLLQWVNAIRPCKLDELSGLTNGLLWELAERGLAIVNRSKLRTTFLPLIDASKEKLEQEIERHHELIAEMYGQGGEQEVKEVSGLDTPFVLESVYAQGTKLLEEHLAKEKSARVALQAQGALAARDREELERLRAEKKKRGLKSKSRKRAAQSRPTKKPRNKRKKNRRRQ